ncbi:hypothetical protein HRG84_07655 [Flavisolibacter sp. BT320]|nr:hypothetical protein [Flavisolibacter longurius]
MKANYNPSVNIVRDTNKDFNYIPTPNAKRVVDQLADDFKKGVRSFNIIGSYGTGKSSFLWALEQSLKKKKPYFQPNFIANPKVELIKIVGSYQSIIDVFATTLGVTEQENKAEHILAELFTRYRDAKSKSALFFIIVDEFGKFLEYAAQHNSEVELYFLQQLAEFVNNTDYNFVLLTTIHQSFDSYAFSLANTQRQEWSKIKGRFKEIVFNEPVEQLLYLVAEHIESRFEERPPKKATEASFKLFSKSKAFSHNEAYSKEVNCKIFPLDITAANVLTLALQRYGQNERSLFSFLEATDYTSIEKFRRASSPFYALPQVYDYLYFNLYTYLTSHYNPDYSSLSIISRSIEEVERAFDKNIDAYLKLVKTIGLLNIFAAAGSVLNQTFLSAYAETCLGINEAAGLIADLEKAGIIFYRNHSKRYILFEGTDLDIHSALKEAGNNVDEITDVSTLLSRYFDRPPVLARKYAFENGAPRYFEYIISDEPHQGIPFGEIDGFINLLFSDKLTAEALATASAQQQEAILYCFYTNTKRIKELLHDLAKTDRVLQENKDDKVAKRELEKIQAGHKKLLQHYLSDNLFRLSDDIQWYWKGKRIQFHNEREFTAFLSEICFQVYNLAPQYRNELVNKHKVSSQISTARKQYFKALVNNWALPDLGFAQDKFPPEKTLYLTLLKENNLATYVDEVAREIRIKDGSNFAPLWNYCMDFLNETRQETKSVKDLIQGLQKRPFKLKQGLIDLWVPSFLFLKREDFALYGAEGFIPELSEDTLDLIIKNPEEYFIKSFDLDGIRLDIFNSYRLFLNQETKEKLSNQTFVETIKPFLTFYRGLKDYTKKTKRLSKEALAVRTVIATAQDPEKTFFEEFPEALGTSLPELEQNRDQFKNYIVKLQAAIRELRTSTEELYNRFEKFIQTEIVYEELSFEEYKAKLQGRFKTLKKHLLVPHQVKFTMRIDSALDDRNAWLSSIVQAVVGKSFEQFTDDDELLLFDKCKAIILELDSLTNLSKAAINEQEEDVLGVEFHSFVEGMKKGLVRLPKQKEKEVEAVKQSVKTKLSKDKAINMAALAKLLKEMMNYE